MQEHDNSVRFQSSENEIHRPISLPVAIVPYLKLYYIFVLVVYKKYLYLYTSVIEER